VETFQWVFLFRRVVLLRVGTVIWTVQAVPRDSLFSGFRVCSVRERSGMECHGSVPEEWNGSVSVFSWDQKIEWNGSIRCSVETRK
jgi:hypothetical protein